MIKISDTSAYSHLANPPQYALCTSVMAIYQPWNTGVQFLKLNYQFGNISGTGFDVCNYVPTLEVTLPTPFAGELHDAEYAILANLFNVGFDFTTNDIDTICAANIAGLGGTVVQMQFNSFTESLSTSDSLSVTVTKAQ